MSNDKGDRLVRRSPASLRRFHYRQSAAAPLMFRLESVVRWLDAADGRLKRHAADGDDGQEREARPSAVAMPKLRRRVGVRR